MKNIFDHIRKIVKYPGIITVVLAIVLGASVVLTFRARPGLVAPPFNGHPTKRLSIYDGTLLIDDGTAQARIGNVGRDIESSGRLYLRPDGSQRGAFVEGSPEAVGQRLAVPGGINGQDTISATWNGEADTSGLLGAVAGHYSGASSNTSGSAVYGQVNDCWVGKTCYAGYFKGNGSVAVSAGNNDATQSTIDVQNSNVDGVAAEFIGNLMATTWNISGNTRDDAESCSWEDLVGGEGEWSTLGSGFQAGVHELTVYDNQLVAGGEFFHDGLNKAAKWDGSNWSGFGIGLQGDSVYAFTEYDTELIAGGLVNSAGGLTVSNIARWNKTASTWSRLGTDGSNGVNDSVEVMTVYDGNLIVGGNFTAASGVAANKIAKWDGANWSALGAGADNGTVYALVVFGSDLIVGGSFNSVNGGTPASKIAKWNGATWSDFGGGINGTVYDLEVLNGVLYAAGAFDSAGGVPANKIAKWTGSNWEALGTGLTDGDVSSISLYNNEICAGGTFTIAGGQPASHIAKWTGSNWEALGTGTDSWVYALTSHNGLIAGGFFTSPGNRIAKWSVSQPDQMQCSSGRFLAGMRNIATPPADSNITSLYCCEL